MKDKCFFKVFFKTNQVLKKVLFIVLLAVPLSFVVPDDITEFERKFPPGAILVAAYRGDENVMREILAENPDTNFRDAAGATALHLSIYQSNMEMIRLLLESGFDPDAVTERNGYTPLHYAVKANNADAARLLLQYNANRSIKSLDGLTPYQLAVKEQKRSLVLLLYTR